MKDTRQQEPLHAVVGSVFEKRGYAVAFPSPDEALPKGTDITFSLDKWEGKILPAKGQVVLLDDVYQFVRGWRASSARPVTPSSDEDKPEGTSGENHEQR